MLDGLIRQAMAHVMPDIHKHGDTATVHVKYFTHMQGQIASIKAFLSCNR